MPKSGVKITSVETLSVSGLTYVRVHTDEGVTGLGEMHPASNASGGHYVPEAAVRFHEEYLLGKDPTQIERHWQHLFRRSLFRGGADSMAALGALDMALWDITGKLAGLPVYKLLGGPTREKVRVFVPVGGIADPAALADWARARVAEGFTSIRIDPVGDRRAFADMSYRSIINTAERHVAAVRDAIPPDVDLGLDPICVYSPAEAVGVGRAVARYGVQYFEDPIEPDNLDAMAYVAANQPIAISTGERLYTIHQFQDLLKKNGAQYLRPDVGLAGGITNVKKIAAIAEAYYVGMMPHNPLSCVLTAACVHVCASIHNLAILEYQRGETEGPKRDLVKEPIRFENGWLVVPDKPGLGIELNDEAFRHYPPVPFGRVPIVSEDGALREY